MNSIYLNEELDKIMQRIEDGDNFMLLRYGDGERSIMEGKPVVAQEGWANPTGETALGNALRESLNFTDETVYYGISCPCCDRPAYYWYASRIENKNITFANMFVNYNYRRFIKRFSEIKRDAIVIANHKGEGKKIGNLNIVKYYSVGDSPTGFWEDGANELINSIIADYGNKNDLLYVVSAGPMAEPILAELYKNNPNNCYVDFGSAIDCYIHGHDTRPYTDESSDYANRNCWMFDPKTTRFDVSVILTSYKKPDALAKQIQAVKQQTLKPKEIILFKDGINEDYDIVFGQKTLESFNKTCISKENVGVWERFRYAKDNAAAKYVCIFDDDTIPGRKWLENCHFNMMHQEGIYGTVGIVLEKPSKYPYGGFYRVGWHQPFSKLTKVDFVGHSWFLKKEYLNYMFDNTDKYQAYRIAAEDMCLSFKCSQKDIDTFVPPHPYYDKELWGSQPDSGMRFGQSGAAISQNPDNCKRMKEALLSLVGEGWKLCKDEDSWKEKRNNDLRGIRIEREKERIKEFNRKVKRKTDRLVNKPQ